jgi:hypothetical protein
MGAYFSEPEGPAAFVAPGLQRHILDGSTVNKDDVFVVKFLFLGYENKVLADKQFVTKHGIVNIELFDLESTGKEAVFFELIPVPESLYLRWLEINNLEM